MCTSTGTSTFHVAVPPLAYPTAFPWAFASETILLTSSMWLTPTSQNEEPMVSYNVLDFRLALNLGPHYLPGYFGMQSGSHEELSSLSPCPFWTKPITYVGLLNVTTIQPWVCLLPIFNCARRSSLLGSKLPPFIPSSRIDGQSLPWGKCITLASE